MRSNKSPVTFLMRDEDTEKVRYIAKHENRSLSNYVENLCRIQIREFEQQHGEIPVKTILKLD